MFTHLRNLSNVKFIKPRKPLKPRKNVIEEIISQIILDIEALKWIIFINLDNAWDARLGIITLTKKTGRKS